MDTTTRTGSPLRQRMIEDMRMRKLEPRTQEGYIRAVRKLTDKPFGVDLLLPASMAQDSIPDRAEMRARLQRDHPKHRGRKNVAEVCMNSAIANRAAMSAPT